MYLKSFKSILFSFFLLFVINLFSQDTIVLQPGSTEGKDAIIHGLDTCMNLNFGNNEQIPACAWTFGGVPGIVRGIIEFDLSSISTSTEIISAKLSLYAWDKSNSMGQHSMLSGSNTCEIRRVISPWEEMSVTWNNQPNTTTQNQATIPETNNPNQNYLDIDVTNLIVDMINDPINNHGFLIKLKTEEHYRRMNFCSSDHENSDLHPKLEIIIGCEATIADFNTSINDLIVEFTDASQNPDNWYWDFGDGGFSTQQNPMHEYSSAGTYNV
ncbi:MAG: DNRLRE domain-containing protein, partial [Bacteroidales bacterium]|nr:DNRLRE domain-containing protein [Bacteroidales bacterium]